MLSVERKNEISDILKRDKRVVVGELARRFGVSEETIRRDLGKLEREGIAVKSYGGAVLCGDDKTDMPIDVRKRTNVEGKRKIAEIVSSLIADGSSVMLDGSSTALFVARSIKSRKNMTVITNSLEILIELKNCKTWKIFSSGGLLGEDSLALVGSRADKMISGFHVETAVISCKGLDMDKGFTDGSETHASTKRAMLESCDKRVLAIDGTKFDRIAFTVIGGLEDIDVLATDVKPSEEWLGKLRAAGVECLYPED